MIFNDIQDPIDSSIGHSQQTAAQTADSTNATDAQLLSQRVLYVDDLSWSTDNGLKFSNQNSNVMAFPQALWHSNGGQGERDNVILTTLNKWRYLKADFNIRVAFNATAYTQGKFVMFYMPLGTKEEAERVDLTRAFQLRHVIIDANSEKDFTSFTVPYEPIYGAIDLVDGMGEMGFLGVLPYNTLKDSTVKELVSKVQINLTNVSLSYNNSIGTTTMPPTPITEVAGHPESEPMYYQNFPAKDYTHSDWKHDFPTLLARDSQQSSSGTSAGMTGRGPFSISSFAQEWGYLGTARYNVSSAVDEPIMTFPVMPAILPDTNNNSTGDVTSSFTPTPLTFAAMQGNWFNGDLKYKFTMTKTQLHAGRIRVIYVPFSTLNRFQPLGPDKKYAKTVAMLRDDKDQSGTWDMTLLSNVRSYVFEVGDSESEFEIHIPYNAIWGSMPVIPTTLNGNRIHVPGHIAGGDEAQLLNTVLSTPSLFGQIFIVPETKLVTQENLTASHVDINVFHAGGSNINFYQFNNNTAGWAESGVEVQEDEAEPSTTIQETDTEPIILQDAPPVEAAFQSFGAPLGSIKSLCSRPVFKNIGFGDERGVLDKLIDPSNFQSDPHSVVPIEYYSKMYRLYQGERKYLLKTPALSLDAELNGVTIERPEWYDPAEPNPPDYADLIEAVEDKHYTVDLGSVNELVFRKIAAFQSIGPMAYAIINAYDAVNSTGVTQAIAAYVDRFTDNGENLDAVKSVQANVRPLIQAPGSFLYHESAVPRAQNELDPKVANSDHPTNELTPLSSAHYMPFEHHQHLHYSQDDWFTPQRYFPNQFFKNNGQRFLYSETSFNNSPFVGSQFRDGPVGIGKYWEIEKIDSTTATVYYNNMINDTKFEEPAADLKLKVLTGQYEAFQGPNIGDLPEEPVPRDTQIGIIEQSKDDSYICNMYAESDTDLVNGTSKTFTLTEFESMLGDQITDFTGTLWYDIVPAPTVNKVKVTQGDRFIDEEGKIYPMPIDALMYMTAKELTHSHDGLPSHTHHADGSITVHNCNFPQFPRQMTTGDLFHYFYEHYKWLVENDNDLTLIELIDILFYIDKYENDNYNFGMHFINWLKRNKSMKEPYWDTLEPTVKMASLEPSAFERLVVESSDAQIKQMLDQDFSAVSFYTNTEVMTTKVTHSVYGFSAKHSHVTLGGYYLNIYLPVADDLKLNDTADVSVNASARNYAVSYTPTNFRSIVGNVVSAESYATNSVEVVRNTGTLHEESDPTVHTVNSYQSKQGLFSFFMTIGEVALDLALGFALPAIARGRSKPSNIKNKSKSNKIFDYDYVNTASNVSTNAKTKSGNDVVGSDFSYTKMANAIGEQINLKFPKMYDDLIRDMTKEVSKANLSNLNELNKKVLSQPYEVAWEPNSVANPATCFCHTFKTPEPETLRTVGVDTKVVATPLEEASAQLSPHPFFGNVQDLTDTPELIQSGMSNSSFSTQLCTRLNNFLPFQIPFYNSSVAQRIGKEGSAPLPGTSRAVASVRIDSQGIKAPSSVAYLSKGSIIPWYALPAQITIPAYGIAYDQDGNYGKPSVREEPQVQSANITTNSAQAQLATYAAGNFTFGEFIGFPKMSVETVPIFKESALKPNSLITK